MNENNEIVVLEDNVVDQQKYNRVNKKDNFVIRILKSIINFYNDWYGVINAIIGLCLLGYIHNSFLMVCMIAVIVIDCFTWYKNIFKNLATKKELFGTIGQNNALCIYGGIGSGKSTLADYILNRLVVPSKRYYNTKVDGYKAFTNEHLLLLKKLEDGAGVLCDESGGQADSYHYDKKDNETRKRIDFLNKFFRQWYTDKALLIYVDQCQGNQNTSLYKNIYYTIQCKGVDVRASALIPNLICKIILFFVNKNRPVGKKINNPFSNVCIHYLEFIKLGDYADHYNVEIDDKDHKCLCGSIYKFFGRLNTYVFKDYNPAKEDDNPYIWGTSNEMDNKIMEANFNFNALKKDINSTFLNVVDKENK